MVKNVPVNSGNEGDASSVPEWGRSPRGVNGNPLQKSCLENPMDSLAGYRPRDHRVGHDCSDLARMHSTEIKYRVRRLIPQVL